MASSKKAALEAKEIHEMVIKSFAHAEKTCTEPWVLDYATNLPKTNITFHQLMIILSAAACIVSTFICLYLGTGHLLHWTRPKQQKQIIRIILFVPAYSVLALFSVWFDHAARYITPWGQWWEAFAMNALFLLYIEIASPDGTTRESFFNDLERRWYNGKKKGNNGSLRWFRGINIMVFQLFFTRIATVLASELLYGLTCPLSPIRSTGTTVIQAVSGTSAGLSIWGCMLLEKRLHPEMHEQLALLKLFSLKWVVGLDSLQTMIIPALAEFGVYQPSPPWYVSWTDFAYALPEFMLAIELVFVAVGFLWSFDFAPYRNHMLQDGQAPMSGPGGALLQSLTITDIWAGVAYAFWGRIPSSWFESPESHELLEAVMSYEKKQTANEPHKLEAQEA